MMKSSIETIGENNKKIVFRIALITIFAILLITRLVRIEDVPSGLKIDEIGEAYDGYLLSQYGVDRWEKTWPVYPNNHGNGASAGYVYMLALLFKFLPLTAWVIRMPSIIFSIINFVFGSLIVYKVTKGNRVAVLSSAFLFALAPIFVESGRVGIECNLVPGAGMMVLWSIINLSEKRNIKWSLISAVILGLYLYTYTVTYLVLPIFLLLIIVIHALFRQGFRLRYILIGGGVLLMLAIPLMLEQVINIFDLQEIKILCFTVPKMYGYRGSEIGIPSLKSLIQALKSILYNDGRNVDIVKGYSSMYVISIPLFAVGIFTAVKKGLREAKNQGSLQLLLLICFFISHLIAFSCISEPNVHRVIGAYSEYAIFVALGISLLYEKIKHKKVYVIILSSVYLICSIKYIRYYLVWYPLEESPAAYCEFDQSDAVNYINNNEKISNKITYTSADILYVAFAERLDATTFHAIKENNADAQDYGLWRCRKLPEISSDYNYIVGINYATYAEELRSMGFEEKKFKYYSVFYLEGD